MMKTKPIALPYILPTIKVEDLQSNVALLRDLTEILLLADKSGREVVQTLKKGYLLTALKETYLMLNTLIKDQRFSEIFRLLFNKPYSELSGANKRKALIQLAKLELEILSRTKKLRQQVAKKDFFPIAIEQMGLSLGIIDISGYVQYINPYVAKQLGYDSAEALIGKHAFELIPQEEVDEMLQQLYLQQVRNDWGSYIRCWKKTDGSVLVTEVEPHPLFDSAGVYIGSYAIFKDLTDLEALKEKLKATVMAHEQAKENLAAIQEALRQKIDEVNMSTNQLTELSAKYESVHAALRSKEEETEQQIATLERALTRLKTDDLTQMLIRKEWETRLSAEILRAFRQNMPLQLILGDIDKFKFINDTYGHPAGDEVIRKIAGIMNHSIRSHDIAGRYGGEELLLILVDTVKDIAIRKANDIRENVQKLLFTFSGQQVKRTMSLGVMEFNPGELKTEHYNNPNLKNGGFFGTLEKEMPIFLINYQPQLKDGQIHADLFHDYLTGLRRHFSLPSQKATSELQQLDLLTKKHFSDYPALANDLTKKIEECFVAAVKEYLFQCVDRALYVAKETGRNNVRPYVENETDTHYTSLKS